MTQAAVPIRVGALAFDGFELLDLFGPLEMLGRHWERFSFSILAETAGPVRSRQGPACVADRAFSGELGLDLLLVPGGMGTRTLVGNAAFLAELRKQCAAARIVASVCTGSALLAKAGVLDGLRATSNKYSFAWVKSQGPSVRWVPKARWVEDGKFLTSSGVSAGMDMALALVAKLLGRDAALEAADGAEYEWHEDPDWDPFAKKRGLA
ncbi:MAG TPA: DJ-1/PfpI family protein [Opitutaceae bacterium]